MGSSGGDITELLRVVDSDEDAAAELAEKVYAELESVAGAKLRRHGLRGAVTLEPSALVNETLLRLFGKPRDFENRRHFYAFASKVMLAVLIDHNRSRSAAKRGGGRVRVTLCGLEAGRDQSTEVLDLRVALEELERLDARKAEIARLRGLVGLETAEVAEVVGVSTRTVEREWRFARSWLLARLNP